MLQEAVNVSSSSSSSVTHPPQDATNLGRQQPVTKKKVIDWARSKGLDTLRDVPVVKPLTSEGGSVIIISGMHPEASSQLLHCGACFSALGFDIVVCRGLPESETPPVGSGYRSSVSWGAVALPKIVELLQQPGLSDSDLFVVCEDSCHPTWACTPGRLSELEDFPDMGLHSCQSVWCGATRKCEKRLISTICEITESGYTLVDHSVEAVAPAGSKMFVVRRDFLKLWLDIYKVSPTAWSVDYHSQMLVGSQLMHIQNPFLAGTLSPHYSHRERRWNACE